MFGVLNVRTFYSVSRFVTMVLVLQLSFSPCTPFSIFQSVPVYFNSKKVQTVV